MKWWTVYLFRSSRVWVMEGKQDTWPAHIEPPLLAREVEAKTDIAAIGKVLLEYVDRANQPMQHVCPPCTRPHIGDPFNIESRLQEQDDDPSCMCGQPLSQHTLLISPVHTFVPMRNAP